MLGQQLAGDDAAHRIAADVGLLDLEMVHQLDDVSGHLRAVLRRIVRLVALSVSAAVDGDDPVPADKRVGDAVREPVAGAVARVAVDQHDRMPGPFLLPASR